MPPGLDLTGGVMMRFRTADSQFDAFGYEGRIQRVRHDHSFDGLFLADPAIRKNVLGRSG